MFKPQIHKKSRGFYSSLPQTLSWTLSNWSAPVWMRNWRLLLSPLILTRWTAFLPSCVVPDKLVSNQSNQLAINKKQVSNPSNQLAIISMPVKQVRNSSKTSLNQVVASQTGQHTLVWNQSNQSVKTTLTSRTCWVRAVLLAPQVMRCWTVLQWPLTQA